MESCRLAMSICWIQTTTVITRGSSFWGVTIRRTSFAKVEGSLCNYNFEACRCPKAKKKSLILQVSGFGNLVFLTLTCTGCVCSLFQRVQ